MGSENSIVCSAVVSARAGITVTRMIRTIAIKAPAIKAYTLCESNFMCSRIILSNSPTPTYVMNLPHKAKFEKTTIVNILIILKVTEYLN
jgi:hypothetical protein